MNNSLKYLVPLLLLLVAFAGGIYFGKFHLFPHDSLSVGRRIDGPHAPRGLDKRKRRLIRHLDLNEQQQKRLESILQTRKNSLESLHQEFQPKFKAERQKLDQEIMEFLRPKQKQKFNKMLEQRRKRHRRLGGSSS